MATATVTGKVSVVSNVFGDNPAQGDDQSSFYRGFDLTSGGAGPEFLATGSRLIVPQDTVNSLGGLAAGTVVTITITV